MSVPGSATARPPGPVIGSPWDRSALAHAATAIEAAARALDAAGAPVQHDVATAAGWSGRAADAADDAARRLAARRSGLVDGAVVLARHLRRAADLVALDGDTDPDVDRALAATLDATARDALPTAATPGSAPPAGADPSAVAAWWSALAPVGREALVRDRPELVGGLDGVPAADRDRANRARLDSAHREAEAAQRALLVDLVRARWIGDLARIGLGWTRVRARLERLTAVEAALDSPGRALLSFEDDRTTTRATVASGDVDTARNVGVFTPGFTAGVADLSDRLRELEALRAGSGPDTAMVAWYGYDAPQWAGVLDPRRSVLSEQPARGGAERLRSFLDGLDAARSAQDGRRPPEPPHVTAIGHSYGTVTTAMATAPGAADGVDDVVVLGSPGIGPRPTRPPGHEWVVEAADDPVADAGWFGADPNRMPGVTGLSAREVVLPDGRVLTGSRGHTGYLAPGSTSSYDVAAVVAGCPRDAILDRGVGVGDRLRSIVPDR